MRILFAVLLFLHLLIHLIGFAKANHWLSGSQDLHISGSQGFLWLLVSIFLLIIGVLFILRKPAWIILAIPAIITSQVLIILNWEEAKFGSILNLIILVVIIFSIISWNFENTYKKDKVKAILAEPVTHELISLTDIKHLPGIVQLYITESGFIGKPKIKNVLIRFSGQMREQGKKWFKFTSEQLNTIKVARRFFFMKAIFKGIPTKGYHRFDGNSARMLIKPLSLFCIIDIESEELLVSEMITYLNDICLFAPGALIAEQFTWEEMGNNSVKVIFTNNGRSVSAVLEIDATGKLINFFSDDRYDINQMKKFRFSTPVGGYTNFDGFHLAGYGEAVWHYPESDFVYGKFEVKKVKYNIEG